MGDIDPAFIQSLEHRPNARIHKAEGIPIIDLSLLSSSNPEDHKSIVSKIGDACENWGFFQVINHGVPNEFREKIESAARKFFALPIEEKSKVRRDEVNPLGYYDTELTKNVRDWKEVFDFVLKTPTVVPASHDPDDEEIMELYNHWPENPSELRVPCEEYAEKIEKLCFKLLELMSLSLGLSGDRLNGFFKEQTTRIRLNHYPPCPKPELTLGVGRHKDGGGLTVLAQDDVGGLQVKRKNDGEWVFVTPTPHALIINVGDIIQVWSNDKYESVEHRVMVNGEKERFSIPVFFNPAHFTMVEPLEELISTHKNPAKYRAYSWGKFFTTRRRSNFMNLGVDNLQIYHYKI